MKSFLKNIGGYIPLAEQLKSIVGSGKGIELVNDPATLFDIKVLPELNGGLPAVENVFDSLLSVFNNDGDFSWSDLNPFSTLTLIDQLSSQDPVKEILKQQVVLETVLGMEDARVDMLFNKGLNVLGGVTEFLNIERAFTKIEVIPSVRTALVNTFQAVLPFDEVGVLGFLRQLVPTVFRHLIQLKGLVIQIEENVISTMGVGASRREALGLLKLASRIKSIEATSIAAKGRVAGEFVVSKVGQVADLGEFVQVLNNEASNVIEGVRDDATNVLNALGNDAGDALIGVVDALTNTLGDVVALKNILRNPISIFQAGALVANTIERNGLLALEIVRATGGYLDPMGVIEIILLNEGVHGGKLLNQMEGLKSLESAESFMEVQASKIHNPELLEQLVGLQGFDVSQLISLVKDAQIVGDEREGFLIALKEGILVEGLSGPLVNRLRKGEIFGKVSEGALNLVDVTGIPGGILHLVRIIEDLARVFQIMQIVEGALGIEIDLLDLTRFLIRVKDTAGILR